MRLPSATASYHARTRFGRYVARRLRRAKLNQLAEDALSVNNAVREMGRAWDDAGDAIQDALADRDAADDDLDTAAQDARNTLAGRSVDAVRLSPYTDVFPNGIGYYITAPLDQEVKRYSELKQRLTENLPASDEVRKKAVKALDAGIAAFEKGSEDLDAARTAEALAATRLAKATDAWVKQMEKTYGALVAELGRSAAGRFFPRTTRKPNSSRPEEEAAPE